MSPGFQGNAKTKSGFLRDGCEGFQHILDFLGRKFFSRFSFSFTFHWKNVTTLHELKNWS